MKFLKPKNLKLEELILSQTHIELKKRTTVGGKRLFKPVQVKTASLIKHLPYCYYLIDLIIQKSSSDQTAFRGYINLRSELLDKVIPHNTRLLITNLLQELGVIDVNTSFSINNFSKSYRLSHKYCTDELDFIELDFNKKGHYIGESNSSITGNSLSLQKGHYIGEPIGYTTGNTLSFEKGHYIGEPINSTGYSISYKKGHYIGESNNKVEEVLVGRYPYVVSFLKRGKRVESGLKMLKAEKTADLIKHRIEYRFQQDQIFNNIRLDYDQIIADGLKDELSVLIEKVNTGNNQLTISVNNKVNRVFSPITSLKKCYRKYLLCANGYSLMAIDFKTSHIFHLIKLIEESLPSNALNLEVQKMKDVALTDIYSFVADQYSQSFNKSIARSDAKDLFIQHFLYGMYPNRRISNWVKSLFPLISEFISSTPNLSIQLQKSESLLLNNIIFKRIAIEADETITAFGLFDSILIDQEHFDLVYTIMLDEASTYFGYSVPLTTDDLIINL